MGWDGPRTDIWTDPRRPCDRQYQLALLFFLPLRFPALLMCLIFMPTKKLAKTLPPSTDRLRLDLRRDIPPSRWPVERSALGLGLEHIVLQLIGGSALICLFVWWETKAPYPFLIQLFRDRQFALIIGFVFGAGLFASGYFIPVFVQTIQNYSATDAGLLLAFGGLIMMVFFPLAGRITDSVSSHIPISGGY